MLSETGGDATQWDAADESGASHSIGAASAAAAAPTIAPAHDAVDEIRARLAALWSLEAELTAKREAVRAEIKMTERELDAASSGVVVSRVATEEAWRRAWSAYPAIANRYTKFDGRMDRAMALARWWTVQDATEIKTTAERAGELEAASTAVVVSRVATEEAWRQAWLAYPAIADRYTEFDGRMDRAMALARWGTVYDPTEINEEREGEGGLDTAHATVRAPTSDDGQDRTEWLPDELMETILLMLPFVTLWSGVCERVCQRWARLMESASIVRHKREGRWAACEVGAIKLRKLKGHRHDVMALAIGLDGRVYSGSSDKTVMVWSGESGAHLQTLQGHTDGVLSLAVGLDGAIYSGSFDCTVRVWSGASGEHVRTIEGHCGPVWALAVGLDGKIYSASCDKIIRLWCIRVWSPIDGTCLQTLVGHAGHVKALAVGNDGAIYSASNDRTIKVWSGKDGTHLRTLVGHANNVTSLAVAHDGKVYSGSWDKTIRVWCPDDGAHLQTLVGHVNSIYALVVGPDGKVFSGAMDGTVRVWSGVNGAHLHTLKGGMSRVFALAIGSDGTLCSGGGSGDSSRIHVEMW
jgi:hypothetical protein